MRLTKVGLSFAAALLVRALTLPRVSQQRAVAPLLLLSLPPLLLVLQPLPVEQRSEVLLDLQAPARLYYPSLPRLQLMPLAFVWFHRIQDNRTRASQSVVRDCLPMRARNLLASLERLLG